ncbi:MAG: hypothetical protein JWR36_831 [Glaciihabitans sp.]|jgi:hypothetical protein|nr:hypothetical protein [Glaciihabitans sp.]MDQ1570253.1 hypothetical protein [Actinomycetota bacterium]
MYSPAERLNTDLTAPFGVTGGRYGVCVSLIATGTVCAEPGAYP